jgi:glucosyl-3-phosphoglycerate synthase
MADFWPGHVPTLPHLRSDAGERLLSQASSLAAEQPVALILPCHARELGSAALDNIVDVLSGADWLGSVIVGLDQAGEAEFARARRQFSALPGVKILWLDGPEMKASAGELRRLGIDPGPPGKGRAVWWCLGWALARSSASVIAVHDCDILHYDLEFLARLVLPALHADWGFKFVKGYYPRLSDRLHGRLTRLFFWPLLGAWEECCGASPLLEYLKGWRYPLAGESAFSAKYAQEMRLPAGWGLETGLLLEADQKLPRAETCQSGLCTAYDHRHQPVSAPAGGGGLSTAAREIFLTLHSRFRFADVAALRKAYARQARKAVVWSQRVAAMNALAFDSAAEHAATGEFAKCLPAEGDGGFQQVAWLPAWREVLAAAPEVFSRG